MALTIEQIILDAGKLVNEISTQESTADGLICKIQSVCNQIDSMKQYQEELKNLNAQTNQKPKSEIIEHFQKIDDGYFKELRAENKDLRLALEDYQKALELIMSKYRKHTAYFLKQSKSNPSATTNTNCCLQYNHCKCINTINTQAKKIDEMATIMRTATQLNKDNELRCLETLVRLKEENTGLREILDMTKKYGYLKKDTIVESKTVQTDDL
ncbi:PREDICTED: FGFR1 oncogene partner 2 homolog [Ceratosolen solmsi marchali]|uniref:FGFR1 oncogene partner 2 homolog n=1 Tax=Ceratosolen solmsi marchali TaxID=326594 RepID=A0AAJ6YNE5_9HYME|nr:PREDICTED: FGFR1 oncogene partner 2 homolog [Ceratosolen solmsi marchali]